ncbi:MAG: cysteine--tRNA ligase [Pseudorhodobacter sp.]
MGTIRLHNSLTRKKEEFTPLDPENVRMYVCGPTVYDRAHLGNARPVVVFDTLYRLLRHVYGADHVTYVRNFTDVDDRINETALKRKQAGSAGTLEQLIAERSEETIGWYHADMDALGALRPDHEPRATQYIAQMIEMTEGLIDKGFAYAKEGHALFRVRKYAEYGGLSGRSVDDMIAGARVEVAPFKEDPMDFVLWKPSTDDLPGWDSPWGRGRPGWHIECSAMAKALLGDQFDIHGGGNDLLFPHHENEIAQSCCANGTDQMAQVWLHNEMLQVEGKKMSKSLGNFFTVRDLLDQGVPGEVIRFVMLSTHYRKPMDWTAEKAQEAKTILWKWRSIANGVEPSEPHPKIVHALSDDLNSAQAISHLHEIAKNGDAACLKASAELLGLLTPNLQNWTLRTVTASGGGEVNAVGSGMALAHVTGSATGVVSATLSASATVTYSIKGLENRLIALRQVALETGDFATLDELKTALTAAGAEVRMSKTGVQIIPGPDFDLDKIQISQ